MKDRSKESLPKLNQLLSEWPKGSVETFSHLRAKGYSKQLLDKYKTSRWIAQFGKGAYRLYNDEIDWFGGLYGMQNAGLSVHAGAKTALELQGLAHYLTPKAARCFLFGAPGLRLSKWFIDQDWGLQIHYQISNLFGDIDKTGLNEYTHKAFMIRISSPERAALEMMHLVPVKQGFDEALRIMENLTTLRPELVQKLMENCRSIKAKRLFMYMAEKTGHGWFKVLQPERIDLGSGKRSIIKNGIFNKKYRITVEPENAH